jgi:hypothetical protein
MLYDNFYVYLFKLGINMKYLAIGTLLFFMSCQKEDINPKVEATWEVIHTNDQREIIKRSIHPSNSLILGVDGCLTFSEDPYQNITCEVKSYQRIK